MAVILIVVFRDGGRLLPILGGLLVSGRIYLAFGAVLAKFGYQRKTLAELRTPRAAPRRLAPTPPSRPRAPKPAPTRRTSTRAEQPTASRKRR